MAPPARPARDRREAQAARRARRSEVTDPDVVMEAAAAFLAVRPRSVAETRRRLRHLGYPAALCDTAVTRFIELGYLDDRSFARAWVESRDRARPRGAILLRQELHRKGIPAAVIDEVLAARSPLPAGQTMVDPEGTAIDASAAQRLLAGHAARLSREADPRRRRQKAWALLARRGFSPDVCHDAVATFMAAPEDPADEGV